MSFAVKNDIRRGVARRLAALPAERRAEKSAAIERVLLACEQICRAAIVALYSSLPDEPQTRHLIAALIRTHRVVLPRVEGEEMDFYDYTPEGMVRGAFDTEEPAAGQAVAPADIDAIVVPARAYTLAGARLGRGRDYYDRYMAREGFRAYRIGVCFAEQIVGEIPTEPHDLTVDRVISA